MQSNTSTEDLLRQVDEYPGLTDLQRNYTKERIEIIVKDNGAGIPSDIIEKIFEPLYSTKNFGVGLGLPVVIQIMQQHGGDIEITSNKGQGTQVILWLPLSLICEVAA